VRDQLPADIPAFSFTSINVNKNYAGRRHRDGSNVGPSIIQAFGKFTGGKLQYFPNDDKKLELEDLPLSDKVSLDVSKHMVLFHGKRAHQVEQFKGERYSVVWFTCPRNDRVSTQAKSSMLKCGFELPSSKDTTGVLSLLKDPAGYAKGAKSSAAGKFRTWTPKAK